jgi:hypothetical protein
LTSTLLLHACIFLTCVGCRRPDIVATRQLSSAELANPKLLPLSGDLELFDPSAIMDGERYWVVSTGTGMPMRVSDDLKEFDFIGDAVQVDEQSYSFYFAYDAQDSGRTSLRISTLTWDDEGWPRSAGP